MAVRQSLLYSLSQRYVSMAISLISTVVLARLLTPEEMGVFFVAAAVMLAINTVANFGVLQYMVQEARLTRGRFRAAVGVVTAASLAAFLLLWVLRGPVAEFYGEPTLRNVLTVYAVTLLTVPLNTPAVAWLQREMRFGSVLIIGVTGSALQAVTAITLAAYGYGPMALAWAALAEQVGITLICLLLRGRATWVLPSLRGWRKVVRIGASVSGAQLLQEAGNLAPQLAIGRLQGFHAAGLFNRGLTAVNLFQRSFLEAVKPVVLPAFSRTKRQGGDVAAPLLRASAFIAVVAWPFFTVTAIMAFPIVRVLFGEQWDAAVPVVRILALTGLFLPFSMIYAEVLIALGRSGTVFRIQSAVQGLRIAATVALAAVSIEAVATAMAGAALLQFVLMLVALRGATDVGLRRMASALASSIVVTVGAAIGPLAVMLLDLRIGLDLFPALAMGGLLCTAGWLAGIVAIRHPLADELWRALVDLRRWLGATLPVRRRPPLDGGQIAPGPQPLRASRQ